MFGADGHREPFDAEGFLEQADQDVLLLEAGQDLADRVDRLERRRHPRRPPDEDLVGLAVVVVPEGLAGRVDQLVGGCVTGGGNGVVVGQGTTDDMGGEVGRGRAYALVTPVLGQLDVGLLHAAVGQDGDHDGHPGPERHEVDGPHAGPLVRRRHHQGGVGGEVGQQAGGVLEHALQLAVGPGEELLDLGALLLAKGARLRPDVVDEEAVALVGGDAPGAGMGMGQEALSLEVGHLVADGGWRHLQGPDAGDMGRADRLGGVDVLLHHGAENGGLALVQHLGSQ